MFNERFIYDVISSLEPSSKDALDIGANYGVYTKLMAPKFSHVYAIEPHPDNVIILNRRLMDYVNTTIIDKAISDNNGYTKLYVCSTNPGGHTISDRITAISRWGHSEDYYLEIPSITIDTLTETHNNVGFIKCDIEGAENFVFKGAVNTLQNIRPTILLEVHLEVDCQELADYFTSFNYTILDDSYNAVTIFDNDRHYLLKPN